MPIKTPSTARDVLRALAPAALALGLAAPAFADNHGCTPSKWGADDEIGSANLVSPERTLEALKLVKQGKSQPLGITIDSTTPAFAPRSLSMQVIQPNQTRSTDALGYGGAKVATALNEGFVPEAARAATPLSEGDRIEVLAPMQGG